MAPVVDLDREFRFKEATHVDVSWWFTLAVFFGFFVFVMFKYSDRSKKVVRNSIL